jgi:hypothetical protein
LYRYTLEPNRNKSDFKIGDGTSRKAAFGKFDKMMPPSESESDSEEEEGEEEVGEEEVGEEGKVGGEVGEAARQLGGVSIAGDE